MTDSQTPPQIFDRKLLALRRQRAARRNRFSFLLERCLDDCAERLLDVNRVFGRLLLIAPNGAGEGLLSRLPENKHPETIKTAHHTLADVGLDQVMDDENLPFSPENFDLIISILNLHSVNDLPGSLIQIRRTLKPDGLFLGALFGSDTLASVRQAAYQVDQNLLNGLTPRIFPFPDYTQLGALLQRAGFAQPVIDRDRVNVSYRGLKGLVDDLRDLGDTNILTNRQKAFLPKAYPGQLETILMQTGLTEAERFETEFDILWMTGWAPHPDQPKPLKPGTAQISLADVIGKKS